MTGPVAEGMRRKGKSCCQREIEDRIREILKEEGHE